MPAFGEVKKYDPERYMCSLFAEGERQKALEVLYAFNLEIAKIKEMVSDVMPGMIRLVWWREVIEEIYAGKNPRAHEVAEQLAVIIKKYNLSQEYFLRIIEGREHDFDEEPPEHISVLEKYAANTSSSLLFLALEILEINDDNSKHVAEHIGIVWCIAGLLRSAYINMPEGKFILFPQTLMNDAGIAKDSYGSKDFLKGSKKLVEKLVEYARFHARKAKELTRKINKKSRKKSRPVFALRIIAEDYLKQIEKGEFDIFTRKYEKLHIITLISLNF